MADETKTFMVEGARLIFRNFAGKEDKYNSAGERNFCVVVDQETADQMAADGWNVRTLEAREEGDDVTFYIPVKVSYKNRPPRVVMITSTGRTPLDEASIEVLDYADMRNVDLIARAYEWGPINGKTGIKAYLQSMFVTLEEDALERKYALVTDSDDLDGGGE
jgi:hypothetical protein